MTESGKDMFLIDGFPRNKDNLDGWNRQMGTKSIVKCVLFFECSNEVCVERCLERGKNSGRSDDNIESLTLRTKTYNESTLPIIQHFDGMNMVKRIDASKTADEVILLTFLLVCLFFFCNYS
jgi:UMP-CMP kinase